MAGTWRREESTGTLRALSEEIYGFIRALTPQSADAADILSDVWEATCRRFEGRSALRYFLYVVARRQVVEFWRGVRGRGGLRSACLEDPNALLEALPDLREDQSDPDAVLTRLQGEAAIARALLSVTQIYRPVLKLRLLGFSHWEIGEALGINPNTARSRAARGRAQLIAALRKQG